MPARPSLRSRLIALLLLVALLAVPAIAILFLEPRMPERTRLRKAETETPEVVPPVKRDDTELVRLLLAQDLGERAFPFSTVIEASTGQRVMAFDQTKLAHREIARAVANALDEAVARHNRADSPVRGLSRINEASRFFEETLLSLLDATPGFSCAIPETADGQTQRAGYPDLRLVHLESGTVAFLDPKLVEVGSLDGSLRTFYFAPKTRTSKVNEDALHLLAGIEHDGKSGAWTFLGWHLVDLSELEVSLKAEFQAANRDLYREEMRVPTE